MEETLENRLFGFLSAHLTRKTATCPCIRGNCLHGLQNAPNAINGILNGLAHGSAAAGVGRGQAIASEVPDCQRRRLNGRIPVLGDSRRGFSEEGNVSDSISPRRVGSRRTGAPRETEARADRPSPPALRSRRRARL